jgi:Raf kinase inhibitor-like YbhB/YbcL family protein
MEKFELSSSVFENEGHIPDLYTCRGKNISPPLSFNNPPDGTESYALIMEDLDTPIGTITHWVLYNIPSDTREVAQDLPTGPVPAKGWKQGRNGMFRFGYMGPCPPWGRHRYLFSLFALDTAMRAEAVLNKRKLLRLIEPHVLARATLLGYYSKTG